MAEHDTPKTAQVRADALREAAAYVAGLLGSTPEYGLWVADKLRERADEVERGGGRD